LVASNVLGHVDYSVLSHSASDLELDSIGQWVGWVRDGLVVNDPSLVEVGVALEHYAVCIVDVLSTSYIKALVDVVLDVGFVTFPVGELLVGLLLVLSHDSVGTIGEALASSSGHCESDVRCSSDCLCPVVELEPLLDVVWVVGVDSQQVLVVSNVTTQEESSVACHLGLQLELVASWVEGWVGVSYSGSVKDPLLTCSWVAGPEDDVSVLMVGLTIHIKALASVVPQVRVRTLPESEVLVDFTSPRTDHSSNSDSVAVVLLIRDSEGSSFPGSDGVSSLVERPPLFAFSWEMVSDPELILVVSKVLVPE